MSENENDISFGIIHYFGLSEESCSCGYCNSTRKPRNTYGLWAHCLPPNAYQELIDRNWRRCGKYLYKPVNNEICCPMYTIRCDAQHFKLSSSQKKVIKRFNNYIKYDRKPNKLCKSQLESMDSDSERLKLENVPQELNDSINRSDICKMEDTNSNEMNMEITNNSGKKCNNQYPTGKIADSFVSNGTLKSTKKKFLRRQKLIQKVMKREHCSEDEAKRKLLEKSNAKQKYKTLEDFISEVNNVKESKHSFKTKIIPVETILQSGDQNDYQIFKLYQMNIHKEAENKINYRSYKRFLLDSPLDYVSMKENSPSDNELPRKYGAYHQHYYIDDCLVAVGVIDILPDCVSSVYLFYDPKFSFLNLGVYSALNEILMVQKLNRKLVNLRYYYMGYYVHQCLKMRYKAKYLPSDLLCSETFRWFPIKSCLEKLEKSKYSRFCDDENVQDEDGIGLENDDILCLYANMALTYKNFYKLTKNRQHHEKIHEYGRLVGRQCCKSLLYDIQ